MIPRGKFTTALLSALRKFGPQTTYAELIANLPDLAYQHPQCEGNNKDCMLFTVNGDKRTHSFTLTRNRENRSLIVNAGALHGVGAGTEFSVYSTKDCDGPPVARMQVVTVEQASCAVTPMPSEQAFILSSRATLFARISSSKGSKADPDLKVFIDTGSHSALKTLAYQLTNSRVGIPPASCYTI